MKSGVIRDIALDAYPGFRLRLHPGYFTKETLKKSPNGCSRLKPLLQKQALVGGALAPKGINQRFPNGQYCTLISTLDQVIKWRGKPQAIQSDNGPECIGQTVIEWAEKQGILLVRIQPGKSQQNAYVERYNRTVHNRAARITRDFQ